MSKVSIEIDGLKFGLRISPDIARAFVEALQTVWVEAQRSSPENAQLRLTAARNKMMAVINTMLIEVGLDATAARSREQKLRSAERS